MLRIRYEPGGVRQVMNGCASRLIGICLVSALFALSEPPVASAQETSAQAQSPLPQQNQPPVPGQPIMPPINKEELPDNPSPAPSNQEASTPAPSPPAVTETAAPPQPTGTAAAEAERPVGTTAARPAGAAIAPPKQRQVRSFLIKMGVIAGAGAALGTVAALSAASPARVPNTGSSR
jgi:hypothetical protein